MKIIVIEGLDKSGKFTQTKILAEMLAALGYRVVQSEFHRYDTPTGHLVMKWLTGKYNVDQATIELIMSADKQAQQNNFKALEEDGVDFLILDRYLLSQIAYSTVNGMELDWVLAMQKYMRKPDLDIVIDIPAEVSMTRKGKHNDGVNDKYESNLLMLQKVRGKYLTLKEGISAPRKIIVDGERSILKIHDEIFRIVKGMLL
jgi:dTMP kinase